MAESLFVVVSLPVLLILGRREVVRNSSSSSSSSLSSSLVQVGTFSQCSDQWKSITSNRFVLNMVQVHHIQLRSHPSLFCNFKQFNIKAAAAHHAIIQKVVYKLPAEGAIEPSSGGAGFYSNVFVVPKQTGGLWPILNLRWFNYYVHIHTFKMPTIRHIWQLIQHSPFISRMLIYIFLLLSSIITFTICLTKYTISVESSTFWVGHSP